MVSNSFACFDTTTTLSVAVNPLPQVQISFSVVTNLCQGDSSLLQVTTDNGNTFQWKSYGVNLMGATDTFYYPSQSGSYSVLVSNAYGCSQESAPQSISINQLPGASILPLSSTSFCDGDSVILQANIGQGLAYQWFKDGVVLVGDTSDQLSVSQTGAYTVEVSNGFQCTSVSSAANVNVFTKPTALFTLPDEKCGSDTVVIHYTGNASSGAFYNWNFGGATVLTGTGQGPYQLRWNTSGTHDVSLMVNENACISEPFSDSIAIKTVTAIVSSSNTSVCQGDSVYLTANAGTNYTYQWYQGGMEITGATSSYLSANSTAHYTVEVSDSVLGCAQMSAPLAVNVFTNDFNIAISANTTNFSQPPFDVSFSNNTPNLSSYLFEWNFGDGNTSNFYQPFHTYLYNGSYTVQLYAENATTGCRDTLIQRTSSTAREEHRTLVTSLQPLHHRAQQPFVMLIVCCYQRVQERHIVING